MMALNCESERCREQRKVGGIEREVEESGKEEEWVVQREKVERGRVARNKRKKREVGRARTLLLQEYKFQHREPFLEIPQKTHLYIIPPASQVFSIWIWKGWQKCRAIQYTMGNFWEPTIPVGFWTKDNKIPLGKEWKVSWISFQCCWTRSAYYIFSIFSN